MAMHRYSRAISVAGLAVLMLRAYEGEELPLIRHRQSIALNDGTIRSVAFSPDGRTVAACGDRLVQLISLKSGKRRQRFEGHTKPIRSVAFSPNGKLIASSSEGTTVRSVVPTETKASGMNGGLTNHKRIV